MEQSQKKNLFSVVIVCVLAFAICYGRGWVNENLLHNLSFAPRLAAIYASWWITLIPILLLMRRDKEKPRDIGFTKANIPQQVLVGVIIGIVTSVSLSGIVTLFGQRESLFGFTVGNIPGAWTLLNDFLLTVITVALVEEILFRGYLFKKLIDINNSRWLAIIGTSVLFGFFHIFNGGIQFIFMPIMMGLIYCLCKDKIKHCSLLALIIAHALHNTLNGSVLFAIIDKIFYIYHIKPN